MPQLDYTSIQSARAAAAHGPKPLLRGWFHAAAAVGAVALTAALLARSYSDTPRLLSMLAFGLSMVVLYTVSAVYHLGGWSGRAHTVLRALDHANIYLFIAGAYTPICVNLLSGWMRAGMLVLIWALAAVGMGTSVLTIRVPRWVSSLLYLGMGWISVALLPQVVQAVSLSPALVLLGGGLLFTAGAVVYALRWPNPHPRVFGFHEIFHLFVIAGTVAVAAVVWVWVLPFPRA